MMRILLTILLILFILGCASQRQQFLSQEITKEIPTTSIDKKVTGSSLSDSINTALSYNRLDFALNLLNKAKANHQNIENYFLLKGEIFERQNRLDSAKFYFEKVLLLAQTAHDSAKIQNINARLGFIHFYLKEYPVAANYFKLTHKDDQSNQLFGDFLRSFGERQPYQLKSSANITTVQLADMEPFPKLKVCVNGMASDDFIFDSGCDFVELTSQLAKKCGIVPFGTIYSGEDSKSENAEYKSIPSQFAIIDSLVIGDFRIYNVPAFVMDEKYSSFKILGITLYKIEGAIGLPIMREFKTIVNYPKKEITFCSGQDARNENLKPNLAISNTNIPYVQTTVNGVSGLNFFLDSGAESSAILQNTLSFLDSTGFSFVKPRRKIRDHVWCKIKITNDFIPKTLVVDKYNIKDFKLELLSEWPNDGGIITQGVIAKDILKNYIVTYDFKNMRLELQSPK